MHGVSTRKVDELVQALGMDGISKSRVSECARSSTRRSSVSEAGRWKARTPTSGSTPPT